MFSSHAHSVDVGFRLTDSPLVQAAGYSLQHLSESISIPFPSHSLRPALGLPSGTRQTTSGPESGPQVIKETSHSQSSRFVHCSQDELLLRACILQTVHLIRYMNSVHCHALFIFKLPYHGKEGKRCAHAGCSVSAGSNFHIQSQACQYSVALQVPRPE